MNLFLSEGLLESIRLQLPAERGTREDYPAPSADDFIRWELPRIMRAIEERLGEHPASGPHGPLVLPGLLVLASSVSVRVAGDSVYLLEIEIDRGY